MSSAEFTEALGQMDPTTLALGSGMVGVVLTLMVVGGILWYFLSAVGYYKMFQKAGQRGWMAFIPLLNDYVRFKMSWNVKSFCIYTVCSAAVQIASQASENSVIASLVSLVAGIVFIVMHVKLCLYVTRSFGKTTLWGVLMVFFPFVVSLILGFGKAEYIGNTKEQAA